MPRRRASAKDKVLSILSSLRQHQHQGKRSPHKPLLVLLALSRLSTEGTSAIEWSVAEQTLADLIRDYGPPTSTRAQRAAYPFTRLRSDDIWILDRDVPMDRVRPLVQYQVVGRLTPWIENALRDPDIAAAAARQLVESEFPPTIAPDVLMAVGLDPDVILSGAAAMIPRRRHGAWPASSGRMGQAVRLRRFRWPARWCSGRHRSGAHSLVQPRRPRPRQQRPGSVLVAPQAPGSRSPRPRSRHAHSGVGRLLQPYRVRPHGLRPSPAATTTATWDDVARAGPRGMAHSRGLQSSRACIVIGGQACAPTLTWLYGPLTINPSLRRTLAAPYRPPLNSCADNGLPVA